MTTTYYVTEAFAATTLEIENPWFIVNADYAVGVYPSRSAARSAKANGLAGKVISLREATFKFVSLNEPVATETSPVEETPVEETPVEETPVEETPVSKGKKAPKVKAEAKVIENRSIVEKPCRLVWDLADAMTGARRKDVIAAAEAKGVAFYTARTQYQLWAQVQKEMADREAAKK